MGETRPIPLPSAARNMVFTFVKERLEKTDTHVKFSVDDVYVVWFAYVLGNWKALVSTSLPDGMYYEVTFDAPNKKVYIDSYKKFENKAYEYREA